MHKILIVEDDDIISQEMQHCMNSWGYEAHCVTDFYDVIGEFVACMPDLVLLDITLPFYNGYHWCTEIRKLSKVPIMFVSSASENINLVMAINMGADDFLVKPFEASVFTAKVQALLRRTYDFAGQTTLLKYKDVILNTSDATLVYQNQTIELTKNEYKILRILMENQNTVVERGLLMEKLWETDDYIDENTLTVNVARLRKKLEAAGLQDFIVTKKGLGYLVK